MDEISLSDNSPLSTNCSRGFKQIWDFLGQCVVSPEQAAGFGVGILAIVFWVTAHIMLFILNQRCNSRTKEQSVACPLIYSCITNSFNAAGAILGRQLATQILFSAYMLGVDLAFWLYYIVVKIPWQSGCSFSCHTSCKAFWKRGRSRRKNVCFLFAWVFICKYGYDVLLDLQRTKYTQDGRHTGRVLLSISDVHTDITVILGYVFGSISTILYWIETIPRVSLIFQEKTLSRMQLAFCVSTILGNGSYVAGVFSQSMRVPFILHTLPWTLGRLGLIGIDSAILIQAVINRRNKTKGKQLDEDIVSLLRNEHRPRSLSDVDDKKAVWVPLKPMKNRYLQKMKKIAMQLDDPSPFKVSEPDTDNSRSSEDIVNSRTHGEDRFPAKRVIKQPSTSSECSTSSSITPKGSEDEWDVEWSQDEARFQLNEEEVYDLLAAEDYTRANNFTINQTNQNDIGLIGSRGQTACDSILDNKEDVQVHWFSETELTINEDNLLKELNAALDKEAITRCDNGS